MLRNIQKRFRELIIIVSKYKVRDDDILDLK